MGTVLLVAGIAAASSLVGGLLALVRTPTSLSASVAFGLASGVLIGTVTLEMVPRALALSSLWPTVAAFGAGFAVAYGWDMYVNRWHLAGERADQRRRVEEFHRRVRPRGDDVTVLAGGTSIEEVIEGIAIGTGVVIDPGVGALVAGAIAVDNLSEGLSIGELIRASEQSGSRGATAGRIVRWTGLIGGTLFGAAAIGWLALRGLPEPWIGGLFAAGAGGMLYLTVTQLVPPAHERQYQGSAALAAGAGFALILVLSEVI